MTTIEKIQYKCNRCECLKTTTSKEILERGYCKTCFNKRQCIGCGKYNIRHTRQRLCRECSIGNKVKLCHICFEYPSILLSRCEKCLKQHDGLLKSVEYEKLRFWDKIRFQKRMKWD